MRDWQLILFENNLIKQLVLIGGGHANVQILKKLCMNRIKGLHTILISEHFEATYSGMTPGYIHRDFSIEEISIDLQRLCFNAGTTFIKDKVIKLETNNKKIVLDKKSNGIQSSLDIKILKEKKLLNKKYLKLKILGTGELKKNLDITAHFASKQALSKIEKAGGKISLIKK